ncbi:J domain-containing protein [Natrinema sp. CGMCC1.2065]|uniref:J domain-containing protein n=1 Tax=Natrinema sp. CGMCC1.2065 TaxID=3445767 RepID=UPI003F4A703E
MTLNWPAELEQTETAERKRTTKFDVDLEQSINDIETEMDRLGVDDWRLETAMDHQSRDPNYPYANQPQPEDPGVVLRWSMGGDQFAVACDYYTRPRDNARAIGLYVAEKRKMENRPVATGQSEFATARLPAADDDAVVASEPPHEVLEISPDADDGVVKAAARAKKKEHHPDAGGDRERFQRVVKAEEAMLDD